MQDTLRRHGVYSVISGAALLAAAHANAAVTYSGGVGFGVNGAEVAVGYQQSGQFTVDGGSQFFADQLDIGSDSVGTLTVSGFGSVVESFETRVGVGAVGFATIESGGQFSIHNSLQIGGPLNSGPNLPPGHVLVTGAGSSIVGGQFGSANFVSLNTGSLTVEQSGVVDLNNALLEIATLGALRIDTNGYIGVERFDNEGTISGSGTLAAFNGGTSSNHGLISVDQGESLSILSDGFTNQRDIVLREGELTSTGRIDNLPLFPGMVGQIDLRDATLRVTGFFGPPTSSPAVRNESLLTSTGGLSDLFGTVHNNALGKIAVTNDSTLVFHDQVANTGGTITVMPGAKAVFLDGLDMVSGTLLANIAGTDDDTGFGIAEVVGAAELAGVVDVNLTSAFQPQAGDRFPILTASGGVVASGPLSLGDAPALDDGLRWSLEIGANQLVLAAVAVTPGDFNADGMVDIADFTMWRDNLDQPYDDSAGNNNGAMDVGDYQLWRENFGAGGSAPVSPGLISSTPEPASALLIGVLATLYAARVGARRRKP